VADAVAVAEVRLWQHRVGAVAEDADRIVTFEYSPDFARLGLEISPIHLPVTRQGPVTFPELSRFEAFDGLPGVLADSLPDRFGNAVIRRYFADRGEPDQALSPVQKLLYIGARGMGALEFRPAIKVRATKAEREALDVAQLVAEARRLVEGRADVAVPHIMRIGASAGGARPKAVILWNRAYNEVRSDFAEPRPGDQHWIIKFDGVGELGAPDPDPQPYNRIEYVYARMARTAGIAVPEMALLRERRLAHFMTRRFDRVGGARLHVHTLGGMHHADYNQPGLFSYEQYLRTVLRLNLGYGALEEAYRRTVFNVAACNQDDHVKNFSFLMNEAGTWTLAPAYDLTFARGQGYTRVHQMTLGGKSGGLTRQDLLRLGAERGIRRDGADVIRQVSDALGSWEVEAREAGVPAEHAARIAGELLRA
jgi:serine/threonine-protein kinase HipA